MPRNKCVVVGCFVCYFDTQNIRRVTQDADVLYALLPNTMTYKKNNLRKAFVCNACVILYVTLRVYE